MSKIDTNHPHHPPHVETHFKSSTIIRDLIIGFADGLTVPFALAAGLSSAVSTNHIIIIGGLAEIIAGSIAMGLGGYLAGKADIDHYKSELAREYREIDELREREIQEVRDIFYEFGLSPATVEIATQDLIQNRDHWVKFMMQLELGLEKPHPYRAVQSGLVIAGSYVVGGIVPLFGYFITTTPHDGLLLSSTITAICLLIFGYFKGKATGQPPIRHAFYVLAIGLLASVSAYSIGRLLVAF